MSLHGFRHTLSWSNDFTQRNEPPPGKEDLAAFTVAPAGTFGGMAGNDMIRIRNYITFKLVKGKSENQNE